VLNRLEIALPQDAIVYLSFHRSIWIQESYGKVVTVHWNSRLPMPTLTVN
jgi:hypothetical protein